MLDSDHDIFHGVYSTFIFIQNLFFSDVWSSSRQELRHIRVHLYRSMRA